MPTDRRRHGRLILAMLLVAASGTAHAVAGATSAQSPTMDGVYEVAESDLQGTTCPATPFRQKLTDGGPAVGTVYYKVRVTATPRVSAVFEPPGGGDPIFAAPLFEDLTFRGGDREDLLVDGRFELDGTRWEFDMAWIRRDASGSFCQTNLFGRQEESVAAPSSGGPPASSACPLEGTVTDIDGEPVRNIHVRLDTGIEQRETATDAQGRYRFPSPEAGRDFDPAADEVAVSLIPEAYDPGGTGIRFQVYQSENLGWLRTDGFLIASQTDCRRDFDLRSIPSSYSARYPDIESAVWPDVIHLYQLTWRAWALADRLGQVMDYGLPLRVYGWCDPGTKRSDGIGCPTGENAGHYVGDFSNDVGRRPRPHIVLRSASREALVGVVYHEFGHAFMADAFGNAMPFTEGRLVPHGGYYVNRDSGDSWIEGFAIFYELMVRKQIDEKGSPSFGSHEFDRPAWLANGKEEDHAVASLLVDLEDARTGEEARIIPMTIDRVVMVATRAGVQRPVIEASAPVAAVPLASKVTARYTDRAGVRGERSSLFLPNPRDDSMGRAVLPIPLEGALTLEDARRTIEVSATLGGVVEDDDGTAIPLRDLWRIILSRTADTRYPYLKTMSDVYRALAVNETPAADSVGEVAGLFVRHGFFADTADGRSDGVFRPGLEEVGKSSHFGRKTDAATYEDMLERPSSPPIPEKLATVDAAGVPAEVVVSVAFPGDVNERLGYGYVARPAGAGRVELDIPPPGMGAHLTLLALADGYEPAILGEVDADPFWTEAERHDGQTFLHYSTRLTPSASSGCALERDCGPGSTSGPPRQGDDGLLVVAGLAGLIGLLLAALVGALMVTRRRGVAAAAGAGVPLGSLAGTPIPPSRPTHAVPGSGMGAWSRPDASVQPEHQLAAGVEVIVTEWLPDGWARIVTSNGWSGWVDGRMLLPLAR